MAPYNNHVHQCSSPRLQRREDQGAASGEPSNRHDPSAARTSAQSSGSNSKRQACTFCAKDKKRCEGTGPCCTRCKKKDKKCSWAEYVDNQSTPGQDLQEQIRLRDARITELETQLAHANQGLIPHLEAQLAFANERLHRIVFSTLSPAASAVCVIELTQENLALAQENQALKTHIAKMETLLHTIMAFLALLVGLAASAVPSFDPVLVNAGLPPMPGVFDFNNGIDEMLMDIDDPRFPNGVS